MVYCINYIVLYKKNHAYFLLILILLASLGCKKDENTFTPNKPNTKQYSDTVLTGRVIDQVSKLPVAGAAVYLGALPYALNMITIWKLGPDTVTDENGKYKLTVNQEFLSHEATSFIGANPYIFASKIGFAGSSYCHYLTSQKVDIELYHPAVLKFRVWNDTINNNIDDFKFAIKGEKWIAYPGYIGSYDMYGIPKNTYTSSGRKYDRFFEWASLWGNMKYRIYSISSGSYQDTSVVLKPDSTASLSFSF